MIMQQIKPWNDRNLEMPEGIFEVKGMLGKEERRFLYWFGRYGFTGAGHIVDAGAFIGASAYCLAAGFARNGRKIMPPLLHSYDLFVAHDQYVADAISRDIRPLKLGEAYLDIFETQNAAHLKLIETHPGDFLDKKWSGDPIEFLFIDIAKTEKLNSHIVEEFFPSLIPGRSIVVQQDFYHVWHPYIHVTMEFLSDYFEIVDPLVEHQSRVYRLLRPIPKELIDRVIRYDFADEERTKLLKRSATTSPSPTREMLEAIAVYDAVISNNSERYYAQMAEFVRKHPDYRVSDALWAKQTREVTAYANDLWRS